MHPEAEPPLAMWELHWNDFLHLDTFSQFYLQKTKERLYYFQRGLQMLEQFAWMLPN
jgi:hypothetical protein